MNQGICNYTNMGKQVWQKMILFMIELFDNVKPVSFWLNHHQGNIKIQYNSKDTTSRINIALMMVWYKYQNI